jgi:hypothetical protein
VHKRVYKLRVFKAVQEKALEPLIEHEEDNLDATEDGKVKGDEQEELERRVLARVALKNIKAISGLATSRRVLISSTIFVVTTLCLLIAILTTLFILFPSDAGRFLGYRQESQSLSKDDAKDKSTSNKQVLGIQSNNEQRVLSTVLSPLSQISLQIVRLIDEEKYNLIVPKKPIRDINNIFQFTEEGSLSIQYPLELPDSSYIKISGDAAKTVKNLDADSLQGHVPGQGSEDIIFLNEEGDLALSGEIVTASIDTEAIIDGAITKEKIAEGILDISGLDENRVTTVHILDGEVKEADLADGVITSAKIKDGTIISLDLAADSVNTLIRCSY